MDARSDGELLQAWGRGEQAAGEELLSRHFEAVVRFFHNKVDRDHEDLIQRTFLGCVEAREQFRGEGSFRAFLFGVARNVLGKHLRTRYREPAALDLAHVSAAELGGSPSQLVADDQQQQLMLSALRRIPLDHQTVLELFYWEDMTAVEIGQMLGVPVGTAKTRLRRAKQLLAAELSDLMAGVTGAEPTETRLDTWARGIRRQLDQESPKSSGS
ncbi:RNA polymerase sigma factor [Paraliomyxa miuraensis]|uniref:RNA polymerase sigma factor n=1 Tax=Paraliomyxa miuraensis TaxID=376150 RepID=UPI00224D28F4|nr:sigma-70 family RNA polymerase sigma factor [Paraliomyxa miuraensis]MCX4242835.1 sigma-70 family RNA polymerase sigma factor [Paraliomyxa miuraensis]